MSYRGGKLAFRLNTTPSAKKPLEAFPKDWVAPQNVPSLACISAAGYAPTESVAVNVVTVSSSAAAAAIPSVAAGGPHPLS